MNQWKVEEFFDTHPNPFNIEIFEFEGLTAIKVYADISSETGNDSYLFELKFENWKKAQHYTRIAFKILNGVDIFRIGKRLFLRKLLF